MIRHVYPDFCWIIRDVWFVSLEKTFKLLTAFVFTYCRQTQWDAPAWDVLADEEEKDMDLGVGTPTYTESRVCHCIAYILLMCTLIFLLNSHSALIGGERTQGSSCSPTKLLGEQLVHVILLNLLEQTKRTCGRTVAYLPCPPLIFETSRIWQKCNRREVFPIKKIKLLQPNWDFKAKMYQIRSPPQTSLESFQRSPKTH